MHFYGNLYLISDIMIDKANWNLSSFLTNFPYFTRLPEPQIVNLYVFSLVFALMGNLQGKSLFIALQPYPEVLRNFALLPSLRERKHSLWY